MPSRQYAEQEARKAQGLCRYCPNPSDRKKNGEFSGLCANHRLKLNERSNRYYAEKRKKPERFFDSVRYEAPEEGA